MTTAQQPKRKRRTKNQIIGIRQAIREIAEQYQPLSVRQLFYRLVVAHVIEKTQKEYRQTVVRLSGEMRESEDLPFEWITDATRWMRKPTTYSGLDSMLRRTKETYRRALWDNSDVYLEVWCESESCARLIAEVTVEYDIPLMPCKGFSSKSFLWTSTSIYSQHEGKPVHILYVGDFDPSGLAINVDIEKKILRYADMMGFDIDLHFERIAVTEDQTKELKLESNPAKQSDPNFAKYIDKHGRETYEVEAIEPQQLRDLVNERIEEFTDKDTLESIRRTERLEKRTLRKVADSIKSLPGMLDRQQLALEMESFA